MLVKREPNLTKLLIKLIEIVEFNRAESNRFVQFNQIERDSLVELNQTEGNGFRNKHKWTTKNNDSLNWFISKTGNKHLDIFTELSVLKPTESIAIHQAIHQKPV